MLQVARDEVTAGVGWQAQVVAPINRVPYRCAPRADGDAPLRLQRLGQFKSLSGFAHDTARVFSPPFPLPLPSVL
jgi:hypothetical protein